MNSGWWVCQFWRHREQRGARQCPLRCNRSKGRRLPRPRGRFRGAPPATRMASSQGHRAWRGRHPYRVITPPKSPARCAQSARARQGWHLATPDCYTPSCCRSCNASPACPQPRYVPLIPAIFVNRRTWSRPKSQPSCRIAC